MPYEKTEIEGVFLFKPKVIEDSRGHFFESFREDVTLRETGFSFKVAQVNNSLSAKGVLRGIHFKQYPPGQAKFVSVTSGAIIDLAIDLRKTSPTFGRWQAFELSEANNHSLLICYGIGHAFLALEDNSNVTYLCDSFFESGIEFAINPFHAGIDWPELAKPFGISEFITSDRDIAAEDLDSAVTKFV